MIPPMNALNSIGCGFLEGMGVHHQNLAEPEEEHQQLEECFC